jgi:hypothetical protein
MLSFSGEEVDGVLKSMKVDTAPSPDGFPVIFFKRLWALVKPYILAISLTALLWGEWILRD